MNQANRYPKKREHAYDTYISSVDWSERIIDEGIEKNNRNWLLSDIARFLQEEYDITNVNPNNQAMWKALELMEGYDRDIPQTVMKLEPVVFNKPERGRKITFKKIVKKAFEADYLDNFKLQEPWHPSTFLSGEFVSYPFQHNSAVVYRGITRDNYYIEEKKIDKPGKSNRNPISILNQGYLNPGNSFNDDNENSVWTTPFLDTAKSYGSRHVDNKPGIVLEIQAPTKLIQCGAHGYSQTQNLQEIRKEFNSPNDYREHVQSATPVNVSFLLRPKLPIKYVTGVWDLHFFDEPHFVPLQSNGTVDAIDLAYKHQENKIPGNPRYGSAGFEDKVSSFIELRESTRKLEKNTDLLEDQCRHVLETIKDMNLGYEKGHGKRSRFEARNVQGYAENISNVFISSEGRGENFNNVLKNILEDLHSLNIDISIETAKAESITQLHREVASIFKTVHTLNNVCTDFEVGLEDENIDENKLKKIENLAEDLFHIEVDKERILESVEGSTAETRNEVLTKENRLERLLKITKWGEKLDKKLKQTIKIIEEIKNQNKMSKQQFGRLYDSLNNYENTGSDEYGYNELLKIGRTKLGVKIGSKPPNRRAKNYRDLDGLEKECLKMEKIHQNYQDRLRNIESKLKSMIKECKELKEPSLNPEKQDEVGEKLRKFEKEMKKIKSQNGGLAELFVEMEGVDYDSKKFKSMVGKQIAS